MFLWWWEHIFSCSRIEFLLDIDLIHSDIIEAMDDSTSFEENGTIPVPTGTEELLQIQTTGN
jgi:hypothetical protein